MIIGLIGVITYGLDIILKLQGMQMENGLGLY